MTDRERIARFLNLDADAPMLQARTRGLRSVEACRAFLRCEAEHQARQSVIAAINERKATVETVDSP
jgi:hypothetical protein